VSYYQGMLVIRKEQMEVLSRAGLDTFASRLASVFLERHPEKFGASGMQGAREFVRKSLPLARKYDVHSDRSIAMCLYFLLLYGEDFASRPENAWAVEILTDQSDADGEARMQRLIGRMEAYAAATTAENR
jgi:hypothetical protein